MRRLVWFVHFHKAGGSTLVSHARRNGEVLYPRHGNGNPLTESGKDIRTWELSDAGLNRFVDGALDAGVTFIASEWHVPRLEALAARDDVTLVTMIREPVKRLVSNYAFDRRHGFTPCRDMRGYIDDPFVTHTQSNFYTRMLAGTHWREDAPGEEMLEIARERLDLIDIVTPLEADDAYQRICAQLGWEYEPIHEKDSRLGPAMKMLMVARRIRRGRWDLIRHVLRAPEVSEDERDFIAEANPLDLEIYRAVTKNWTERA